MGGRMQPVWVLSLSNFRVGQFCPSSTSNETSAAWRPTGRKLYSAVGPSHPHSGPDSALSSGIANMGLQIGNGNYAILPVILSNRKDEVPCLIGRC